jgi:hypothetical protein
MVTESARGLDPGLLERDELIAALDVRIASMRSGSGGTFVWIGGEAGVGKTALLRHFCERQIKPVRVLWGGVSHYERRVRWAHSWTSPRLRWESSRS